MIFRRLFNLTISVVLIMAGASAISPNVRIYNLENWVEPEQNKKAKAESFGPGTYNFVKDKKHKDWNNRITSVRVPKGWAVTFFEHQMKGHTKTYLKDEDKLGK